jgi:hypothetical protein
MISFEVIKGCSPADSHIALWLARRAATQCRSPHYAVDELHQHHRLRGAVVLGHRPGGREIKPPAVLLAALAGIHVVGAEPVGWCGLPCHTSSPSKSLILIAISVLPGIHPTTRTEQIRKTLRKAMVDPYIPRVR